MSINHAPSASSIARGHCSLANRAALLFSGLCLMTSSIALGGAPDMNIDLNTPFLPRTSPLVNQPDVPLPEDAIVSLRRLLQECGFIMVFRERGSTTLREDAGVRALCGGRIDPVYLPDSRGRTYIANRVLLRVGETALTALSWDSPESQRGEIQSIAFYNSEGTRVAVYRRICSQGNIIDGLAELSGARLSEIARPAFWR